MQCSGKTNAKEWEHSSGSPKLAVIDARWWRKGKGEQDVRTARVRCEKRVTGEERERETKWAMALTLIDLLVFTLSGDG